MLMVKTKAERVCYDLELDLNRLYHLSEARRGVELTQGEPSENNHREEPLEEEGPMEGGELNLGYEPELAAKSMEERILPDLPRVEPVIQSESDIEMWEPLREAPTYIEISSEDERRNWGSNYDLYDYETGYDRGWSEEEDPEEEVPKNHPRDGDNESEEAYSNSSSDSGEDGDDEDFDIASYDKTIDFLDAWR